MKNSILFLDTETGGLNPAKYDLLSVGLVVWQDGSTGAGKEILLKGDRRRVTEKALAVNRIALKQHNSIALGKKEAAAQVMAFIEEHFEERPVIVGGHNVGFDMAFMKQLFDSQQLPFDRYFSHRYIDTGSILQYIGIRNNFSNQELQTFSSSDHAFRHFCIEIATEDRHTALADAIAAARLFTHLVRQSPEIVPNSSQSPGRASA